MVPTFAASLAGIPAVAEGVIPGMRSLDRWNALPIVAWCGSAQGATGKNLGGRVSGVGRDPLSCPDSIVGGMGVRLRSVRKQDVRPMIAHGRGRQLRRRSSKL